MGPRAHQRHVARVVAHALLLLERSVVLFVDDHHADPGQRREHRRPRADHDAGLAARDGPLSHAPLDVAERAVQHHYTPGEAPAEARGQLRRERDLRHQHQRLPSERQRLRDRLQVDLGLARPGHAVQHEGAEPLLSNERLDGGQGARLRLVERGRRALVDGDARERIPHPRPLLDGDQPYFHQLGDVRRRLRIALLEIGRPQLARRLDRFVDLPTTRGAPQLTIDRRARHPQPAVEGRRADLQRIDQRHQPPLHQPPRDRLIHRRQRRRGARHLDQERPLRRVERHRPRLQQHPRMSLGLARSLVGERQPLPGPRPPPCRHHQAQHLAQRRHVVVGHPARQLQQVGRQLRRVDALGDRFERDSRRRRRRAVLPVADDHPFDGAAAQRHPHARPGGQRPRAQEVRRHVIVERALQRRKDSDRDNHERASSSCMIVRSPSRSSGRFQAQCKQAPR